MNIPIDILLAIFGVIASIAGYLLRSKDKAQGIEIHSMQEHINLLYAKHETDVMALQELRIQLAGKHYERAELDERFGRMEAIMREGLASLGRSMDKLSEAVYGLKHHD